MRLYFLITSLVLYSFMAMAQTNVVTQSNVATTTSTSTTSGSNDEFNEKLFVASWGAVCGGVAGVITSLLVNVFLPRLRRWNLTRQISIWADPPHGGFARLRVVNGGFWTIGDATLYIALDIQQQDVLPPPNGCSAHILPQHFAPLTGDQLCWSVRTPTINPLKVPIYAKERQPFSVCCVSPDWITIPSEEGWPPAKYARVFLRRRQYTGTLKLVSADTNARCFRITIDPDSTARPCTVEPVCCPEPLTV